MRQLRSSRLLPFLVLGVSLATTGIWWYMLDRQGREQAQSEFESEARQAVARLREDLSGFEEVLQAGAGLMTASDIVSAEEWARFVDRLELPRAYPGIETVNFAERVSAAQAAELETRMRAAGKAQFHIHPAGVREEYVVNVLVEPFGARYSNALGFDLFSEPTRRRALVRARDTNAVSLSGQVRLKSDVTSRAAFMMFAPVYRKDGSPPTVAERRAAITGYVTAAFHLDTLVTGVLRDSLLPLGIAVWDGRQPTPDRLMYVNTRGKTLLDASEARTLTMDIPFELSGEEWTLRFLLNRNATTAGRMGRPLLALAAGIPLSLLLFGMTWSEATLRARATKLASQMTEAVRQQAELLDLTHDTIFLHDRSNIIRFWNRAARDTYGYTAEEAIGRTADDLLKTRFTVPAATVWEEIGRNDRWEGELVHTRRDGTQIIVSSRWSVQRGPDGKIESILETNNDITERRRAEEDRKRLESSLLQAQKLEAMGTLAGGVAHDFNNILGAVLGYGELAQSAAPEGSALRRYVDNMMAAGLRAKSLVERILAFSRSGVGPRTDVNVQSVVAEALELLSASLADNIRLEPSLVAENAAVMGDATQIHQVVFNLCTNAIQAMKHGGTLTVKLDCVALDSPHPIITGTLAPGEYVRLCVRDTGIGIDPAQQARIFDPFFTTKGVGVGTGLGLSLVHGIVTDLGGGVDMTSEVNRGTTFAVYLPRHGQVGATTTSDETVTSGNGESIMLVDDEETLVRLGEEILAGLGYEPVGFTSPLEALRAVQESPERFAAVLSDETMPGMTGSQLTEQIIAVRADMPIILMSGYAGPTLAARARAAGARDVLAKPLQSRDLARALANLLRQSANREVNFT
ncbi:MAG: CHASE domain-containing protein [Steroidobacteraceae bacterium]|nr:CHASE domain-containing protein [Steroidobacteraceae bacterium]